MVSRLAIGEALCLGIRGGEMLAGSEGGWVERNKNIPSLYIAKRITSLLEHQSPPLQ